MHDDNESFVLFRLFVIGLECIWYFREISFTILYDLECRLQQFHRVQRFQISYCIENLWKMKKTSLKYVQKRNKPFEQSHCNINNRNSVLLINKKKKMKFQELNWFSQYLLISPPPPPSLPPHLKSPIFFPSQFFTDGLSLWVKSQNSTCFMVILLFQEAEAIVSGGQSDYLVKNWPLTEKKMCWYKQGIIKNRYSSAHSRKKKSMKHCFVNLVYCIL